MSGGLFAAKLPKFNPALRSGIGRPFSRRESAFEHPQSIPCKSSATSHQILTIGSVQCGLSKRQLGTDHVVKIMEVAMKMFLKRSYSSNSKLLYKNSSKDRW